MTRSLAVTALALAALCGGATAAAAEGVRASASASASASSSSGARDCETRTSATAEAEAGDRHVYDHEEKTARQPTEDCSASAHSTARVSTSGNRVPPQPD